jgi:hydrogenase nickel incorporation protein HypA/HybF
MHEYPITQSIVQISNEEALKHGAKKITEIRLKVGELSGLVPESLQIYFDMISQGTLAEGAKLMVEIVHIKFICNNCGNESGVVGGVYKCPKCDSKDIKIINGNEYMIDSMEVE